MALGYDETIIALAARAEGLEEAGRRRCNFKGAITQKKPWRG